MSRCMESTNQKPSLAELLVRVSIIVSRSVSALENLTKNSTVKSPVPRTKLSDALVSNRLLPLPLK